jgi:hypothetical protein
MLTHWWKHFLLGMCSYKIKLSEMLEFLARSLVTTYVQDKQGRQDAQCAKRWARI